MGIYRLPVGYIPAQDKGELRIAIQLPDATALEHTREVVEQVDGILRRKDQYGRNVFGVRHVIGIWGSSFVIQANGSNFGQIFVMLDDYRSRRERDLSIDKVIKMVSAKIAQEVPDARVTIFPPPPVAGLGTAGGFQFMVEDRGSLGLDALQDVSANTVAKGNDPNVTRGLTGLMTVYRANAPQLEVEVNLHQCQMRGVNSKDVYDTLQIYLGSLYVNDFNNFGRTWQVIVQSEADSRSRIEDVKRIMVRNKQGGMVPLGSVAEVKEINGPLILTRYNLYPAAAIRGNTLPGYSSGDGINMMEQLAEKSLPRGM